MRREVRTSWSSPSHDAALMMGTVVCILPGGGFNVIRNSC